MAGPHRPRLPCVFLVLPALLSSELMAGEEPAAWLCAHGRNRPGWQPERQPSGDQLLLLPRGQRRSPSRSGASLPGPGAQPRVAFLSELPLRHHAAPGDLGEALNEANALRSEKALPSSPRPLRSGCSGAGERRIQDPLLLAVPSGAERTRNLLSEAGRGRRFRIAVL